MDVVGLHGQGWGKVLLVQRLNADEHHPHTPLLRLAHAFAKILIASNEIRRCDSPLRRQCDEVSHDPGVHALLTMRSKASKAKLHARKIPNLNLLRARNKISRTVVPVRTKM